MGPEQFSQALRMALKAKYGRVPSCQRLVDDLYALSAGTCSLSAEAARKWLNGKTTPRGVAYIFLEQLLNLSAHINTLGVKRSDNKQHHERGSHASPPVTVGDKT